MMDMDLIVALSLFILGIFAGVILSFMILKAPLVSCAREKNVYACEYVAMPSPVEQEGAAK